MNFDLQPLIVGQLVELHPLKPEHLEPLYAVASDPLIWDQHPISSRYQRPVFEKFFAEALQSGGAFLIKDRKTGTVIGSSRYYDFNPEKNEVIVGYTFVARKYWGQGHNREMKSLLLEHAFQFVENVLFHIDERNLRSRKAIEKIGATFHDRIEKDGIRTDGTSMTTVVYKISKPSVTFDEDIQDFMNNTESLLEEQEAINNLILGLSQKLLKQKDSLKIKPLLARLESGGKTVGAALQTPQQNIVLSPLPPGTTQLLANTFADQNRETIGVVGLEAECESFATAFSKRRQCKVKLGMYQGLYVLRKVRPPQSSRGELKRAQPEDAELVAQWSEEFVLECMPHEAPLWTGRHMKAAEDAIQNKEIYFLEEGGEFVSMAGFSRPTKNGIAVNRVYTPPAFRRQGFASQLVALQSQEALNRGYAFCMLYTDMSNPTSNAIYQKVGYELLAHSKHILFEY